jgi:phosphoribosylamine--glycine ligase
MKVLVVGGGGREHALVWKLSQSPLVDEIFVAPGNGGISEIAECVNIKADDISGILRFSRDIDYVIVGPENPLANGLIDCLPKRKGFGPARDATLIESNKSFAKKLMKRAGVPTPDFKVFNNCDMAITYINKIKFPIVIKASGLAAGKGTHIVKNKEDAVKSINSMMVEKIFGESGKTIIIEEYLEGNEVSLLVFTDGKNILPLIPSQDHKRLYDNDKGPNTGGMGAYAPVPFVSEATIGKVLDKIIEPTLYGLKREGILYKGVLYAGLIKTEDGIKVLEFNARFGDPETQAILPLLNSDLMEPILATIEGRLSEIRLKFLDKYATCVVLASGGYPGKYEKGKEISGLTDVDPDTLIFHSGTKKEGGKFYTSGGRVLGVTALGPTLKDSIEMAYKEVKKIHFDGVYYRRDIGRRGLKYS